MDLHGKTVLVTGAAVRIGRAMSKSIAAAGANLAIHYKTSQAEAQSLQDEIRQLGVEANLYQADLRQPDQITQLIEAASQKGPLFGLVNNAAIFQDLDLDSSDLGAWQRHLDVNLTAPFLLSQAFWRSAKRAKSEGRIINMLDWRALRPGADHLPYTISKAGLAALTRSLAATMAPQVTVNGLALGAVLPPTDSGDTAGILRHVPVGRWAELDEVGQAVLMLLTGPSYITGEIIHLDGGRHLV